MDFIKPPNMENSAAPSTPRNNIATNNYQASSQHIGNQQQNNANLQDKVLIGVAVAAFCFFGYVVYRQQADNRDILRLIEQKERERMQFEEAKKSQSIEERKQAVQINISNQDDTAATLLENSGQEFSQVKPRIQKNKYDS